ncbi:MAG: TOMM system kinase/cyclase fusion protein [Marinobacterium sp.]|nr:TOMM system kinase/cyclase fusion protein [Marinobacterium sp.]
MVLDSDLNPAGYSIIDLIGAGGTAQVYKARQHSTGQSVALKVVSDNSPGVRKRFSREISLYKNLQHPKIIRILDCGETAGGFPFVALEYLTGETLDQYLIRHGCLGFETTIYIMSQVLDAIIFFHSEGIVHRDIKPSNILIVEGHSGLDVKIFDFGSGARTLDTQSEEYLQITTQWSVPATAAYTAPEQLRGAAPDVRSDIYAWALVFVECLIGKPLVSVSSTIEAVHKQLINHDISLPLSISSHPVGGLLRRALKKQTEYRLANAQLVWNELQSLKAKVLPPLPVLEEADIPDAERGYQALTEVLPETYHTRRDIAALCISIDVASIGESRADPEDVVAIQDLYLNRCADFAARYSGTAVDYFSNCVLITFGYPESSYNVVHSALQTTHNIISQLLGDGPENNDLYVSFRAGIDIGPAVIGADGAPRGILINNAQLLCQYAAAGSALVSEHLISANKKKRLNFNFESVDYVTNSSTLKAAPFVTDYSLPGTGLLDFCGRTEELGLLYDFWKNQAENTGKMLIVNGESGIGKSRLVNEFSSALSSNGVITLRINCWEEKRNIPLHPVFELIFGYLDVPFDQNKLNQYDLATTKRLRKFCQTYYEKHEDLLAIIASWAGISLSIMPELPQYSALQQRMLIINSVEAWLRSISSASRILIVVEDIHWADPTTLEFIRHILTSGLDNITLVANSREKIREPVSSGLYEMLFLGPLSRDDIHELICGRVGNDNVSEQLTDKIVSTSDGVPIYVEEMVDYFVTHEESPENIPFTFKEILGRKLKSLGASARTIKLASCVGRTFSLALLATASSMAFADIELQLQQMVAERLVVPMSDSSTEVYCFRHMMIHDVIQQSMTRAEKLETHAAIASALSQSRAFENEHQQLALHYAAAEEYMPAVHHGISAAQQALSMAANEDAEILATQAMKWAVELPDTRKLQAELALNDILTQSRMLKAGWADEGVRASAEYSLALLDKLDSVANDDHYASIWSLAIYYHVAGERKTTARLASQLVDEAQNNSEVLYCNALGLRGQAAFIDGEFEYAQSCFQQALEIYEPEAHRAQLTPSGLDTKVWSLSQLATMFWLTGSYQRSIVTSMEALQWARKLKHVPSFGIALMYRGILCHIAGVKPEALQASKALLELAQEYDLPAYMGYATVQHAWATSDEATLSGILASLRQMGCQLGMSQFDSLLADIYYENGQIEEAISCLEQCMDYAKRTGEKYYLGELTRKFNYVKAAKDSVGDGGVISDVAGVMSAMNHPVYNIAHSSFRLPDGFLELSS